MTSRQSKWARRATAAALPCVVLALACAQVGRKSTPYGAVEQARAEQLFASLQSDRAAKKFDPAAATANDLINNYPRFARIDEALLLAGEVASERGQHAAAATYFETLAHDYPASPVRARALDGAAKAFAKLGDDAHEAEALIELLAMPADAGTRSAAQARLTALANDMTASDLDALARKHPDSMIARATTLKQARAAYAAGDYDRCHELLFSYVQSLPRGESGEDARRLMELAAERRQTPPPGPATRVNPDAIGILMPQTGNLALYGRLFEQGARIAIDEHNASSRTRRLTLVVADSRGSAVGAVKAVRRLIVEEGVAAVVGDVFTLPAVAGAIEANAWRTPIVSPVVASDELVEIGQSVFQTRVPSTVEATAVAEVAVATLARERFAVLAPERGDRREVADFFAQEVRRLGRQVIAVEYFEEGATDFRTPLEKIRDATPDALFVTGSIDELLQILPQVKFHDLQVQLLGLSQWNSDKLLRLARDELEGAMFPDESHYGSTLQGDAALRAKIIASGATEVSPVTLAGYYGTRVVVSALEDGASSREDVRAFLERSLRGDAQTRAARAAAVPLMRVRAGRPETFTR